MIVSSEPAVLEQEETQENVKPTYKLILHNDDVNPFDYVVNSVSTIMGYDPAQAEQLTIIAHFKEKSTLKEGDYDDLESYHNQFSQREIRTSIEKL
jgi:ATP-dependent Clp protease adaptor protein ClpS